MSDDIKKLVERLRAFRPTYGWPEEQATVVMQTLGDEAADALEALAGEVEDLKSFFVGVEGPKLVKKMRDEVASLTAERDRMAAQNIAWADQYGDAQNAMYAALDERDRLKDALVRLRDCDWVITLPDRMDAVREIARNALEDKDE